MKTIIITLVFHFIPYKIQILSNKSIITCFNLYFSTLLHMYCMSSIVFFLMEIDAYFWLKRITLHITHNLVEVRVHEGLGRKSQSSKYFTSSLWWCFSLMTLMCSSVLLHYFRVGLEIRHLRGANFRAVPSAFVYL